MGHPYPPSSFVAARRTVAARTARRTHEPPTSSRRRWVFAIDYDRAVTQCAEAFSDSGGVEKACKRVHGMYGWSRPFSDENVCSSECTELGRKLLGYHRRQARCCDGSRSRSFTYGTMRSGCCSSHGGVCVEDRPRRVAGASDAWGDAGGAAKKDPRECCAPEGASHRARPQEAGRWTRD